MGLLIFFLTCKEAAALLLDSGAAAVNALVLARA